MTMNSKLMYLPLKELQHYLTNLEFENERLKSEITKMSRFNCILENIRRSSNKGFNSMQLVDRNKTCRCNEHLNGHLRRMAQEADIELRVWQEQYDKLLLKTKQDYMATYDDDSSSQRSASLSPRSSSTGGFSTPPFTHDTHGDNATTMSMTSDTNHSSTSNTVITDSRFSPSELKKSPIVDSNANFRFNIKDNDNYKTSGKRIHVDHAPAVRYMSLTPPATDESTTSRSPPPTVIYESKKLKKSSPELACDWPDCDRVFADEEILTHHRRTHIRKSIYHCEFCSTRLLSKTELDIHMTTHTSQTNTEPTINVDDDDEDTAQHHHHMDVLDVDNMSEHAVNLSNKNHNYINGMNVRNNIVDNNTKNGLTFQSALFGRLSAAGHHHNQTSVSPPIIATNGQAVGVADHPNSKANSQQQLMKSDEYKRTRYSGVGRYRCPWPDCGYTPHFLRDLRRHMFKHTGDKKHKCESPGCDFVSVWKTSLLQHQRKKHFISHQLNTNQNNNDLVLFNAKV